MTRSPRHDDTAAVPGDAPLLAGAGRAEIDIPAGLYPVDGFAGEHDALHARVLVLDNGSDRIALVVIELTSIFDDSLAELTTLVTRSASVRQENVIVSASHTFSAPHIPPLSQVPPDDLKSARALQDAVNDAVLRAVTSAVPAMRPAQVTFGTGSSNVNVNRDVHTADGWWLGTNEAGDSDKSVAVLGVEDLRGRPIALLMNYAVQSSVMNESLMADGTKFVTADLAGAAARHVEQQYGDDMVALFLIGAAGDQAPYLTAHRYTLGKDRRYGRVDVGAGGYLLVDLLGERLGAEAVRVGEQKGGTDRGPALRVVHDRVEVPAQRPLRREDIRPTTAYEFTVQGRADVPVWAVRIGDVALVGVQVELSARTGMEIKRRSPFPNTIVMTMVNGAAKYLPDARSYDRITYEAMASRYARGSAELVTSQVLALLADLRH